MSAHRIRLKRLLIAVLFLIVLAIAWLVWDLWQPDTRIEHFSPTAWKQAAIEGVASGEPSCVRGGMALDLIDQDILPGQSDQQVLALLGAPDEKHPGYWIYHLGECSGRGWNDSDLRLQFDASNTLVTSATFEHVTVPETR